MINKCLLILNLILLYSYIIFHLTSNFSSNISMVSYCKGMPWELDENENITWRKKLVS